jgi:DNA-binding protein H-NS
LAKLNWHPTIGAQISALESERREQEAEKREQEAEKREQEAEKREQEAEKRLKQLESEIVLLKESNARIARFEQELLSCSTPAPSTGDSSPT